MSLYAFLLVLLLSLPAWAATYYVAATGGLDSRSCATAQTIGTPKLTITSGATCLSPWDTLIVRNGTYNESLDNAIPGGTSASRVTLKSETPRGATIRGSSGSTVIRFASTTASYVTIDGFVIDATNVRGQGFYLNENGAPNWSTHLTVQNCEVKNAHDGHAFLIAHPQGAGFGTFFQILHNDLHDNGSNCVNIIHPNCGGSCGAYCHGIYLGSSDNLVDGNTIHHNSAQGIQSYVSGQNPSRNIIKNNQFYNNGTVNLGVYFGSGNEVYNNIVHDGGSGIVAVSSGVKVYNNTVTANGVGIDCRFNSSGDFGAFIKNNIVYNNGGGNITQCTGSATVANTSDNTTADPGFAGSQFANFKISSQFSPAVTPPGAVLGAPWNTDIEGIIRPSTGIGYTKGAHQFTSGTPPSPATLALYKADGTATDSGGHPSGPFHGTLTSGALANGAGIISGQSFIFNGTGAYVNVPGNATLRPPAIGMALWVNTSTPPVDEGCNAIRMGNAWSMGWEQDGRAFCWINFGPTATMATGTVLTGTNQMLACGYDPSGSGPGIRLWQGATQVAFTSVSAPIVYSGSENLTIGGNPSGGFNCAGRIDEVRLANFAWQQSDIDAMFGAVTPATGISMTHQRYSVANMPEGNWIGPEDTDQSLVVTSPWGQRWSFHLASGSPVTENFRPYCRINHLGTWGAWTELTNSFGSFGLRYLTDTAVNVGDTTTPLLTLDGFTGVPGKFFADVVTVGSGFPTSQKIALATGQHAEQEIRLQAGSPVVAGDLIQCKPYHESNVVLNGGYGVGDSQVRTLTMLAVIAPATVRLGGVQSGGTFQ